MMDFSGLLSRAREELLRAGAAQRIVRRSGALADLTAGGVRAIIAGRGRTNPSQMIRFHAANTPDRVALIDAQKGGAWAYRELDEAIDRTAAALLSLGMRRGDSVLLALKNTPELFWLQQAANRIGGAGVSVSWRSTGPELGFLLENSRAKALFFDFEVASAVKQALVSGAHAIGERAFAVGGEVPGFGGFSALTAHAPTAKLDAAASEEGAHVVYTSGTTGKPKGAVRKFSRDSTLQVMSFLAETPMRAAQRHLAVCPLYHSTAWGFANMACALGNTIVLLDFEPNAFLAALGRYRIHHTAVVPTMLYRTLELGARAVRACDTSDLLAIFCGGAPLSPTLAAQAMDAFGDKLFNFYGATETGLVTVAKPHDLRLAPGTIGRVIGGNDVRLLDDRGSPVPAGAVGELYVKSGNLVAGYHANDAATRASMSDGYFSVGDLARRDPRGYLFLEGRKRDMIISGGVNVYPREVESAIAAHPGVGDVAVIGVPDPEWGERVHAFVEPRPGAAVAEAELLDFCRERLAGPKRPRAVTIVAALPRNPTGKILKRELAARLG